MQYSRNWQVAADMASTSYHNLAPWLGGGGGAGGGRMGGLCVGAYAFSFGWVWQASATWINMLNEYPFTYDPAYDGKMVGNEQIEPIDTLAYLWSGKKPAQLAPTSALPLVHALLTPPAGSLAHTPPHLTPAPVRQSPCP
jgi:hypothetical protein